MKSVKPLVPIILILIGLGVGFFGGYSYRNYQLNKLRSTLATGGTNGGNFQRFLGGRSGNGGFRGGAVQGSILSMDSSTITVKLADGSTKIVLLSGSTIYSNTASASQSDLKTGENVAVFGTPNSDGSVTATSVQLNPMMFRPQGTPPPATPNY